MSESNDVNSVLLKIQSLYSAVERERVEAENWLRNFTSQEDAWQVYISLLSHPELVVAHFGAQALSQKLDSNWETLSQEKQEEMLQVLVTAFTHFTTNGPPLLLTRVCIAISQIIRHTFIQRPHILHSFMQLIPEGYTGKEDDGKYAIGILKLFEIIPQELKLSTTDRNNFLLQGCGENGILSLIQFLEKIMTHVQFHAVQVSSIVTLSSWVFPMGLLKQTTLIQNIFSHMYSNNELLGEGAKFFSQYLMDDVIRCELQADSTFKVEFVKLFIHLNSRFDNTDVTQIDEDIVISCAFLIGVIGKVFSEELIQKPELGLSLINQVIYLFVCHPNALVSRETFVFWKALQKEIQSHTIAFSGSSHVQNILSMYEEPFSLLTKILCEKILLPGPTMQSLSKDDVETYRKDAADLIMFCYLVLNEKCHSILFDLTCQTLLSNDSQQQWALLESIYYLLKDTILYQCHQSPIIGHFILKISSFPHHNLLKQTVIAFLGECADWLNANPNCLGETLNYFFGNGFDGSIDSKLFLTIANSFEKVSRSCGKILTQNFNDLANLFLPLFFNPNLPIEGRGLLLRCLIIISNQFNFESKKQNILELTQFIIKTMENSDSLNTSQQQNQFGANSNFGTPMSPQAIARKRVISECLALLLEIGSYVEPEENQHVTTLLEPLQLSWPLLDSMLQNYCGNDDEIIVENFCSFINHALPHLGTNVKSFVDPLLQRVWTCFSKHPYEHWCSVVSTIVTIYFVTFHQMENHENEISYFRNIITLMSNHVFGLLTKTFAGGYVIDPQLLIHFFQMLKNILDVTKNKRLLIEHEGDHNLFTHSVANLAPLIDSLVQRETLKSILSFLEELIVNDQSILKSNSPGNHFALLRFICFAMLSPNYPINMIKHIPPLIVLLRNKGTYAFPLSHPSDFQQMISLYQQENQKLYQQQQELQKLKIFEFLILPFNSKDEFLVQLENCATFVRNL